MTKHTPGPWLISKNDNAFFYALNNSGVNRFSAYVSAGLDNTLERTHLSEIYANVHLIAAAPDLLDALKWYAEQFCELSIYNAVCSKLSDDVCSGCRARAAIARAEAS
jgi:hypothetical protein